MIYNLLNGPYINNENRRIVFVGPNNKEKKCISYARYLMSEYLGRELTDDEVVDHKDENKLNDCLENYQIITTSENNTKYGASIKGWYYFLCPICGNGVKKSLASVQHNKKQNKAGPFCSKSCAGKYSREIQLGRMVKLVNTIDLKSIVYGLGGSMPSAPTKKLGI